MIVSGRGSAEGDRACDLPGHVAPLLERRPLEVRRDHGDLQRGVVVKTSPIPLPRLLPNVGHGAVGARRPGDDHEHARGARVLRIEASRRQAPSLPDVIEPV